MSRRVLKTQQKRALKEESETVREVGFSKDNSLIPPYTNGSLPPQDVLKLYKDSFDLLLGEMELLEMLIQTVKGDLYNRDYIQAFSDDDRRSAYCCRWSPSRSLCYQSIFSCLDEIKELFVEDEVNVLSIGGGAGAELVAVSSLFIKSRVDNNLKNKLNLKLIDIANWENIVNRIRTTMHKTWIPSEVSNLNIDFINSDILSITDTNIYKDMSLITLLFTTNELFHENRSKAVQFLQNMTNSCSKGCYLLILESAGSYSHIEIGSKKFPIQFLVDTILLGKDKESGSWALVNESDSCWYRVDTRFKYDLKLENMRFFFRLYRKK